MSKEQIKNEIQIALFKIQSARETLNKLMETDLAKSTTKRIFASFIQGSINFAISNLEALYKSYEE